MPEPGWTFIPIDAKDGAERASVLDWETLLATCQTPPLTVGQLKSERIAVIGADGTFDRTWSAYNCVVFETRPEEDASLYVLTGGEWFAVDGNFAQQALEFVDTQLSEPNPVLAFAQAAAGIGEDAYNRGAADAIGALCLDRELFRADEARDEVEACDLLTRDGQLVHVKKKEGSKSLSHLFAQGLVAGELLVGDRGFRERLADHAAERGYDVIQVEDYRTNAHEVVYAIIAPEPQQGRHLLPFFSQVNLWRTAERLLQLGYRVSLVRIDQL